MVRAWIYNEADKSDQRTPHQTSPPAYISIPHLQALGVNYWHLPPTPNPEAVIADPLGGQLGEIRRTRQYKNHDVLRVTPAHLPGYDEKIRNFFNEHLHEDEEIRYILDGQGYFDVRRDKDEAWIRIEVSAGDMIVLPAGMYHRYTNDTNDYVWVMRLFKDNPKWEAINRGERADGLPSRSEYLASITPRHTNGTNGTNGTQHAAPLPEGVTVRSIAGVNGESFTLQGKAGALANYPHMRAFNGLLYVSGISSRRFDNTHDGVTTNADGSVTLDIAQQTRAVLSNIQDILSVAGADLGHVVDLTTFLVDMKDYSGYNAVYNEFFPSGLHGPARTTVAVHQLPHPNLLIEIKCVAVDPRAQK